MVSRRDLLDHPNVQVIGTSTAARTLRQEAAIAARFDVSVFLIGEQGVGKQWLARQIHQASPRGDVPFIVVRCGRLSETQLEARLFGDGDRLGALGYAAGATVFLDDVDRLPPRLQERLLHFIGDGGLEPSGSLTQPKRARVRIISSTQSPLLGRLADSPFREELYYRLNTMCLPIPPLRERREDIEQLLEHFATHYARRRRSLRPVLTREWRASCRMHDWPGNVRELQASAARMVTAFARSWSSGRLPAEDLHRPVPFIGPNQT
jgi:DNA-binding NtrC family response regulator